MHKILPKNNLGSFVELLKKNYNVYIPQKRNGDYVFVLLEKNDIGDLKSYLTILSPKKLFYPQNETLFEFANNIIKKPKPCPRNIKTANSMTTAHWSKHGGD